VLGQGLSGAGLALALDAGGDDRYVTAHLPVPVVDGRGKLHPGLPVLIVFGASAEGVGVSFDGGGRDSMRVLAETVPVAADDQRPFVSPFAVAEAFGWAGQGAVGLAMSGEGDTDRLVSSRVTAPATESAVVGAFGYADIGALGATVDAGGNDVYRAVAVETAARTASIADGCACTGVGAVATARSAFAYGAGDAGTGGVGFLLDEAGDDLYDFEALSTVTAIAEDHRTTVGGPSPAAEAEASNVVAGIAAEGMGDNGIGALSDLAGNDRYVTRTSGAVSATATAPTGAVSKATAMSGAPGSPAAETSGIGAGYVGGVGLLTDSGGEDLYETVNSSSVTASPQTRISKGGAASFVMGFVDLAAALFADLGGVDSFAMTPAAPPCSGSRGDPTWRCDSTGIGINR
jgi:hypothetical protein